MQLRIGDKVRGIADNCVGIIKRTGSIVEVEMNDGSIVFYGCLTLEKL